jgi:hypothetical protein
MSNTSSVIRRTSLTSVMFPWVTADLKCAVSQCKLVCPLILPLHRSSLPRHIHVAISRLLHMNANHAGDTIFFAGISDDQNSVLTNDSDGTGTRRTQRKPPNAQFNGSPILCIFTLKQDYACSLSFPTPAEAKYVNYVSSFFFGLQTQAN